MCVHSLFIAKERKIPACDKKALFSRIPSWIFFAFAVHHPAEEKHERLCSPLAWCTLRSVYTGGVGFLFSTAQRGAYPSVSATRILRQGTMMKDQEVRKLLQQVKTIAVVGAKDRPGSAVDMVGRYLMAAGYRVIPVHPMRENVWGVPTYKSITDIPEQVDLVDVFRAPEFCLAHAQEALLMKHKPQAFWMQLGISNSAARLLLEPQGIQVVEDACIKVEYARLCDPVRTEFGTPATPPHL